MIMGLLLFLTCAKRLMHIVRWLCAETVQFEHKSKLDEPEEILKRLMLTIEGIAWVNGCSEIQIKDNVILTREIISDLEFVE